MNLSVNTDKRFSNELDAVFSQMNSRPTGINSGDVSPDIKQKQDAGQSQSGQSRGGWVLNGAMSQRNHSLTQLIEPAYLQRIRKYCGSDSDEPSTEEDTHESQSQKKIKNSQHHQTIVLEKLPMKANKRRSEIGRLPTDLKRNLYQHT